MAPQIFLASRNETQWKEILVIDDQILRIRSAEEAKLLSFPNIKLERNLKDPT